jgi:hypothetical protein
MKGPEPWFKGISETISMEFKIDQLLLDQCVASFSDEILSKLSESDLKELIILDDVTTLNGYPGVKFIDKMNRQTSMGFPYRKAKINYLLSREPDEVWHDAVEFTPEVMDEVRRIEECYAKGERVMPVFVASLKDEPLPQEKIDIKKTRVFMGAPAPWSFVVRKHLLSFIRVFQRNPFIFEAAPGVNCKSHQWGEFYGYLTKHGKDRMIAGDYSKFDKRMDPMMILAAFQVIGRVIGQSTSDPMRQLFLQCIAEDIAYPLADVQGDFVEFFGSNPSGQPLTVIINCICNSLYMRMAYSKLSPAGNANDFQENVSLLTYGDDNAMGVSPAISFFDHTTIQEVLAHFGVVYTMADKHAVSVPFLPIEKISFLKRTWRWDSEAQAFLCPLDWTSLDKMLTSGIASDAVCAEEQAAMVIASAMSEFWQYGRKTFELNMTKMRRIVETCRLENFIQNNTFQPWESHYANYLEASGSTTDRSSESDRGCISKAMTPLIFDLQCGMNNPHLSHNEYSC